MKDDYIKYYKIYRDLGTTQYGRMQQLVTIVENELLAKAICSKEFGFSYTKVEVNKIELK